MSEIALAASAAPSIVVLGPGEEPPPADIAAEDLATDPERWEGVLLSVVDDLVVTVPALGSGSVEAEDSDGNAIVVGDQLYSWSLYGSLTVGQSLGAVTGPLDFSSGAFIVEPRDEADMSAPTLLPREAHVTVGSTDLAILTVTVPSASTTAPCK